jgi:hypothetical protein
MAAGPLARGKHEQALARGKHEQAKGQIFILGVIVIPLAVGFSRLFLEWRRVFAPSTAALLSTNDGRGPYMAPIHG